MSNRNTIANAMLSLVLLGATMAVAADAPKLLNAKDVQWTDIGKPAGAKEASLWTDASSNDSGVLVRWQYNSKLPNVVHSQDAHILVITGTFTLDIGGRYVEFGPGGFATIPRGTKHSMGCEAVGECTFLLHLSGSQPPAAGVSPR